jgi:hypothetical protein
MQVSDDEFDSHILELLQRASEESDDDVRSVLDGYRFQSESPEPEKVKPIDESTLMKLRQFAPRSDLCTGRVYTPSVLLTKPPSPTFDSLQSVSPSLADTKISSLEKENRKLRTDMIDTRVRVGVLEETLQEMQATVAELMESVRSLQKVNVALRAAL